MNSGMLVAKKTAENRRDVGGFRYYTPTCCFHMASAEECGIHHNRAKLLITPQLQNIRTLNTSPLLARRGLLADLTPSMVKETGRDAVDGLILHERCLDGGGEGSTTRIAFPVPIA